jgi:uncharacterized protein involved in exopolysaccharide biosynthesis
MNPPSAQSTSSEQLRPGDGVPGSPSLADNAPSPDSGEQPFFRLDLMRSLQLHRGLALGIALAGLALAVANGVMKWPVYTAQSQVYIQPAPPKAIEQSNSLRWPFDTNSYESFIQQQLQSASHPEVLLGALHKMPPGSWQRKDESELSAAGRLGRSIEVARLGSGYQIAITARAADAGLSALIANAMAASIVESASREERAGDAERLTMLRDEQGRVQKELAADRAEQESLNAKLGMAAVGITAPDRYDDDISRIHEELVKARTAHDEAAARLITVDAGHAASSAALNAEADELVVSDLGLVSLKTSLNQQRALLITQMANLTPNHPQYKQDAEELAQINASLDSMTKDLRAKASERIQQRLHTDLDRTADVEARLNAQLGQMTGAAVSATPKLQRANDLATDIVRLQTRNASVDEQLHNLMIEDSAPGAAHLSATAVAPLYPTVTGILRQALILVVAGVLFGLLAAVAAHKMDPRVYIATDVERVLGFPPMSVLPDFDQVTDGVAEEHLLRLSATIEHARQQGNLKSCIFTGTGPGVGVTTVSTRVRTLLEAMGRATVLVDASGTPPPSPRDSSSGLGLQDTSSQLATQRGSRSTALLAQLAEERETEVESLIITDTAPLVVSAETEYLARFVDCAIVVVESGVTTRLQLRQVANSLQRLDVVAVGFVLNRVGLKKADPAFRKSIQDIERHLRAQSGSFKEELENIQKQKQLLKASDMAFMPQPDTHVFYVTEWMAANPEGDVDAAKAEAKRQGYEVVEQ